MCRGHGIGVKCAYELPPSWGYLYLIENELLLKLSDAPIKF